MLEFAVRCSTYICDVKFSVWGRPLGVKKGLHAVLLTRPYGTVSCNVIPYLSIHPWSNPLVTCESCSFMVLFLGCNAAVMLHQVLGSILRHRGVCAHAILLCLGVGFVRAYRFYVCGKSMCWSWLSVFEVWLLLLEKFSQPKVTVLPIVTLPCLQS